MMISVRCAKCRCVQQECINVDVQGCSLCTKDVCCCENIHNSSRRCSTLKKPLTMAKIIATPEHEDCCASGSCENNNYSNDGLQPNLTTRRITSASTSSFSSSGLPQFLRHVKALYAAALGIEILCIAAAEIGENTGLYLFGFNPLGIAIAYAMGYSLAGFTTFITILGRYNLLSSLNQGMCSCCSVLEQDSSKGFVSNLSTTFRNFLVGLRRLPLLYNQPNL